MSAELRDAIENYLGDRVAAQGFAPVERFDDAPEKHHPSRLLDKAQTVVVFGIPMPRGIFFSPEYELHALHRTYHTVYRQLDEIALGLCNLIESQGRHRALSVPSYAPMVFHELEPWGLVSLKHAARNAGLGAFGLSGQLYHPRYGSRLRLAAVVTSAEMGGDPLIEEMPCPRGCTACQEKCPAQAYDQDGNFDKMACLSHTIKHAIYPLALSNEKGLRRIERVINTAGHDYWLDCDKCLKVCPLNRK